MPDYNLTKSAQAVEDSLALIDEGNSKLLDTVLAGAGVPLNAAALLANTQLTPTVGQTIYHTGNTGVTTFNGPIIDGSEEAINLGFSNVGAVQLARATTASTSQIQFYNPNGQVDGDIC